MKELFLGGILVVLLFLLWRKEEGRPISFGAPGAGVGPQPSGGCGGSCGGPSAAASPLVQPTTWDVLGMGGQITPGTPPLQGATGVGSFYNSDGPTPDTTFPTTPQPVLVPSTLTNDARMIANVPGSPTTPANIVPTRAVRPVGTYAQTGFQQRYNIVGVPRVYASKWVM
jgi:hypothetical protein